MKQEWKHYLDNSFERKNKKSCRPCIIIICRETLNVWSCKMLKKVKKENHKTGKVHIYKLKKEQQQYSTHKAHDRNKLDQVKIMRQYMSNLFGNCIITHYFVYFLSLSNYLNTSEPRLENQIYIFYLIQNVSSISNK